MNELNGAKHQMTEVDAIVEACKRRIDAVEKAAIKTVQEYRKRLDAEHEQRKPSVQVWPVHEVRAPDVTVNVAALPVDLVLKMLGDLHEAATAMPVPVIQAFQPTVVPPAQVTVDMARLERLLQMLLQSQRDAVEQQLAVKVVLGKVGKTFDNLATALSSLQATNAALLVALSKPRPVVTGGAFNEDGTFTLTR